MVESVKKFTFEGIFLKKSSHENERCKESWDVPGKVGRD